MIRSALCAFALAPLLWGACGDESPEGDTGGGGAAPAQPAPEVITEEESGARFELAVGAETSLRLSNDYEWGEPAADSDAVALARVDYLRDPGYSEWVVTAQAPGEATVSARGEPCTDDGCPDAPLDFRVRITVTP